MMMNLLVLVVTTVLLTVCRANEHATDNYNNSSDELELENFTKASTCISQYNELERYVESNDTLKQNLAEAFFKSGHLPSKFVNITYEFCSCNQNNNGLINRSNCDNRQNTYIWSESALYLLGPQPLCWLTFYAVCVSTNNVTVQLPCICSDVSDSLLSRLTYLVKISEN